MFERGVGQLVPHLFYWDQGRGMIISFTQRSS